LSEEKRLNPVDHRLHGAAASAGGAIGVATVPQHEHADHRGSGGPSFLPDLSSSSSDDGAKWRFTPGFLPVVAMYLCLMTVFHLWGWLTFGAQPYCDGSFVTFLIGVALLVHLVAIQQHRPVVAVGSLLALMLVVWHHAFAEMWHRWFPAWETLSAAPITTRLSAGDSYYSHGPLVPIASIIICYLIHQRVGVPTGVTRSSRTWGAALFGFSLFLQLMAARGDVNFLSGFALVGILGSLVLLWGGWPLARAYWLPVVFLLFMVPLPMDTIAKINYELKTVAAKAALFLTNRVFGVVAVLDGATVHLVPDSAGNAKKLVVENVCGGLRSMISLICFGTLFALVCRVKGYWRWFMLALSVPLAIACNIARITSMNVVAHHFSVEAAGEESWFHTFSGIMVFALALAAMFGIERIIIFASNRWKKDWVDQRLLGYLDELPPSRADGVRPHHPVAIALLVLVAALTTFWVFEAPAFNRGEIARSAVPADMVIDGQNYRGIDGKMSDKEMAILQTNDYLKRRYSNGQASSQARREVDLTIVFSANNRKGTHPPDVCIEGGGARIVSKQLHEVGFDSAKEGQGGRRTVEMRELISEMQNGYQVLHLYLYKCGDSYTPNYLTQQMIIFLNGMVSRNSAGALIRVDVEVGRADPARLEEARQRALIAAAAFLPKIDRGLP